MDDLLWSLRNSDRFTTFGQVIYFFVITYLIFQWDLIPLLMVWFAKLSFSKADTFVSGTKPCHDGLVIIPSLLRNREDYDAIVMAVDSCANNHYPKTLVVIASVDGCEECPDLCGELVEWASSRRYPDNIHIYVIGGPTREGKIIAIDSACKYMQDLVAQGKYNEFPPVYFSMDGDSVLSDHALERLAVRLATPHFITGNLRRVVSGKIYIRKDLVWNGWRNFFSISGHIHSQVAREFITKCTARFNWRIIPRFGLSGALYCTWSEMLIQAPKYMGFLQSIRFIDYFKWLLGFPPPLFSESSADPIPHALTGSTDDTSMACLSVIARWENGKMSFDAPRTPLHAIGRLITECIIERSHDYDPEARVYTYTPSTIKGLWNQRVRWNSSRLECFMRFTKSLFFHFDLTALAAFQIVVISTHVISNLFAWVVFPFILFGGNHPIISLIGVYLFTAITSLIYFVLALLLELEYKDYWKASFSIPFSPIYNKVIGAGSMTFGIVKDVLISGNRVRFVPEETLIKGKSERIAILFRIRRFVSLCIRSVSRGDVYLGFWWLGFREHYPYVESGYKGWTTGKNKHYLLK